MILEDRQNTFYQNFFMVAEMLQNIFSYSTLFYLKDLYIYLVSKKCFSLILSFKENIFIFNHKYSSMKCFYTMNFSSQIWPFICLWNSVQLLHGLHSDLEERLNHKHKLHLTGSPLRFVFCLRKVKCTFTGSVFVLDCIVLLYIYWFCIGLYRYT